MQLRPTDLLSSVIEIGFFLSAAVVVAVGIIRFR
ncbi:MAG: hypothetical protein KatS3mg104_1137 [Phycisphaerae bacterium]|jgi:hypothetical protein|nr:MAG: hypothetical protein KatS3mg104_1137 [Phycisphaerae bacterium]